MSYTNMFDSHIHTGFSTDSRMSINDAIKRMNELNIGIVLTEHMDIDYPLEGHFFFDPDEYFKEYSKYRNERLLLGIELGMKVDCVEKGRSLVDKYPFDYVLGSIHLVDNVGIYDENFYKGKRKLEVYRRYLDVMLECLKIYDFIDSLGHIDYIARYSIYSDRELYIEEFYHHIDKVLREVSHRGIALELNTRRLDNRNAAENIEKIYKRFHELGGRYITIGSDSHSTNAIGSNFKIAEEIADRCKLRIVYFKERKPKYIK